jgi:hypothetical protein
MLNESDLSPAIAHHRYDNFGFEKLRKNGIDNILRLRESH